MGLGLFKRFFSIGSKKFKKRSAADPPPESLPPAQHHLGPIQVDDTEAAVSRLLRSSSGRFAAGLQIGLSSLPPIPHPIDSVIPHPKSSSTSIASISARSTYSVTIHGRTVHSRTEFPNAYPPLDVTPKRSLTDLVRRRSKSVPITPRDKNRLLLLRQDPSVASLLHHYDNDGHLNSTLFSNTPSPQKEWRVQRSRTGSTLRQLLGHPSTPELRNTGAEGDISWAERFLGETDGNSSQSSIGPQTPADVHFTHIPTVRKAALSTDCDTSSVNQRTFSSLEVELSASADLAHPTAPDRPHGNSMMPQRASQIFGFLGDKKRAYGGPVSRLPQLKTTTPNYRRFSAESSASDTKRHSQIPLPIRSCTSFPQSTSPTSQRFSLSSDASRSPPPSPTAAVFLPPQSEDKGSRFSQVVISQHTRQSSRSSHRLHPPSIIPSRQSTGSLSPPRNIDDSHPATTQLRLFTQPVSGKGPSTDKYISVPGAQPREMHSQIPKLRTASGSSSGSVDSRHNLVRPPCQHPISLQPRVRIKPTSAETELSTRTTPHNKDDDGASRLSQPITPVRSFGLHLHHLREQPSPASSSELSPVAKQMMANLRQQRMHARQQERLAGRLGSSQSGIRY